MICVPPEETGAVHESETCASPGVAMSADGAPGTAPKFGVAVADADAPAPDALRALTRTEIGVPFVRPPATALRASEPELTITHVVPSSDVSTMYSTSGRPPVETGAVQVATT
jgi:hypothetical protein